MAIQRSSVEPLSARYSCGGLRAVSHIDSSSMRLMKLTEMEVVVLGVAKRNQEANHVDER